MINGEALASQRTLLGLSQRRLAALAGLNFQIIRRLEAGGDGGNLTLRDLHHLANALGTTAANLLQASAHQVGDKPDGTRADNLTVAQARLLRRIQRGELIARSLTEPERTTVLPSLVKAGLVHFRGGRLTLAGTVASSLSPPLDASTA